MKDMLGDDLLVTLGDDSNQEVQQNDQGHNDLDEPEEPNNIDHREALDLLLSASDLLRILNVLEPAFVSWRRNITDRVPETLEEIIELQRQTRIILIAVFSPDDCVQNTDERHHERHKRNKDRNIGEALWKQLNEASNLIVDSEEEHDLENPRHQNKHIQNNHEHIEVILLRWFSTVRIVVRLGVLNPDNEVDQGYEEYGYVHIVPDAWVVCFNVVFHFDEFQDEKVSLGGDKQIHSVLDEFVIVILMRLQHDLAIEWSDVTENIQ